MAHELIDQKKDIDVEGTANQWIDDLIDRFMIEETEYKTIKLHDILRDLALYIGGKEYSHAYATEHTRHLSLFAVDDPEVHKLNASRAANKLRTLLGNSDFGSKSDWPLVYIKHLTTNFKWLRVLSLRRCQMDELPKSIEDLALLKYLDLTGSNVRQLPSSIGRLCNLQTLDLSDSKIEELPKEMGELYNLRYLGLKETRNLKFIAEGLGKLTNLRTLHRFLICDDKGYTKGCNINELKDLKKLKGKLSIEGLSGGRVKVVDAKKAELKEKHELIGVKFNFKQQEDDSVGNASEDRGLLEALVPPHEIESLEIWNYKGDRPAWYFDSNYGELRALSLQSCPSWAAVIGIKSLKKLLVDECPTLCALPSMPLLKSLRIKYCDGLNTIGDMPALESLMVERCERLEQVADDHMPALKTLWLSGLNILKQLPTRLPSLEVLLLNNLPNWESTFSSMPCLREADFRDCPRMEIEGLIDELAGLRKLRVVNFPTLCALPRMPLLKSLTIWYCDRLNTIGDMPALESLEVEWCKRLEQVGNHHMPALKTLKLSGLYNLKQFPTRLPSLKVLDLSYLPNWESTFISMPCLREASFTDCPKIQIEGLIDELAGLRELRVLNCPRARLRWKLLEQLPNLILLELDPESAVLLVPSPLSSQTFLPSLKRLQLWGHTNVDGLKWGRVPEWVWGLSQLESLSLNCFYEDISLGGHWQCLPKLKSLGLDGFPNLKSLVEVNNNITLQQQQNQTTCPTDAQQQQIACLSNLQSLIIFLCPALHLPQELSNRLGERLLFRRPKP